MKMCSGKCNSVADDYCGMYMDGEECPACKTIREKRDKKKVAGTNHETSNQSE